MVSKNSKIANLLHIINNDICFEFYLPRGSRRLACSSFSPAQDKFLCYLVFIPNQAAEPPAELLQGLRSAVENVESAGAGGIGTGAAAMDLGTIIARCAAFLENAGADASKIKASFVYIDTAAGVFDFAGFGGFGLMAQKDGGSVEFMPHNNAHLGEQGVKIERFLIANYAKILLKTGKFDRNFLNAELKDRTLGAFKSAYFLDSFEKNIIDCGLKSFDRLALAMINFLPQDPQTLFEAHRALMPDDIPNTLEDVRAVLEKNALNERQILSAKLILNEILLNAIEHGNLAISFKKKQQLILQNKLDDEIKRLLALPAFKHKKVSLKVLQFVRNKKRVFCFRVRDDGAGFDVGKFFKKLELTNHKRFHGRGIIMSKHLSDGVFYNLKGNEANLFFIKAKE